MVLHLVAYQPIFTYIIIKLYRFGQQNTKKYFWLLISMEMLPQYWVCNANHSFTFLVLEGIVRAWR